jgi:hypothetical protein
MFYMRPAKRRRRPLLIVFGFGKGCRAFSAQRRVGLANERFSSRARRLLDLWPSLMPRPPSAQSTSPRPSFPCPARRPLPASTNSSFQVHPEHPQHMAYGPTACKTALCCASTTAHCPLTDMKDRRLHRKTSWPHARGGVLILGVPRPNVAELPV